MAFKPPTVPDVLEYMQNNLVEEKPWVMGRSDIEDFFDHFENCDWRLSSGRGSKMKCWQRALRRWERTTRERRSRYQRDSCGASRSSEMVDTKSDEFKRQVWRREHIKCGTWDFDNERPLVRSSDQGAERIRRGP